MQQVQKEICIQQSVTISCTQHRSLCRVLMLQHGCAVFCAVTKCALVTEMRGNDKLQAQSTNLFFVVTAVVLSLVLTLAMLPSTESKE